MLLGEVMKDITPDANFVGIVTNDDMILAININGDEETSFDNFAVVQGAIEGVDAQMNPITQDKTYIRAGTSTAKTGTQRTFSTSGDRYIGDPFQDYVFDRERMYGVGQAVVTDYVWFCMLNGKGETGQVSLIANSDSSGSAGETAAIDVELRKMGAIPAEFMYSTNKPFPIVVTP